MFGGGRDLSFLIDAVGMIRSAGPAGGTETRNLLHTFREGRQLQHPQNIDWICRSERVLFLDSRFKENTNSIHSELNKILFLDKLKNPLISANTILHCSKYCPYNVFGKWRSKQMLNPSKGPTQTGFQILCLFPSSYCSWQLCCSLWDSCES